MGSRNISIKLYHALATRKVAYSDYSACRIGKGRAILRMWKARPRANFGGRLLECCREREGGAIGKKEAPGLPPEVRGHGSSAPP